MSYMTMRDLTIGADFGAQMMVCAGLYRLALSTDHTPSIITNKDNEGYRLRITPNIFKNFYNIFSRINYTDYKWEYKDIDTTKLVDEDLFKYQFESSINYNFPVSFSTYHYWKDKENDIKLLYEFNDKIVELCQDYKNAVSKWGYNNQSEVVGVHFRRGDYLKVSSLNLQMDYYYKALKHFDPQNQVLLIFSNTNEDLRWVEQNFKPEGFKVYYTDHTYPDRVDMCLMSLCDHMIMANSSYSWWGAFLNKKEDKKIICPYNYLNVPSLNFINGNYYPKEWISIQ